jgi:alpha-glucosidase
MNRLLLALFCLVVGARAGVQAQDIVSGLVPIGAISSFSKTQSAVTFDCKDGSQVRIMILAPDLVRVRAAFAKPLPSHDHSWAIARESWEVPRWVVSERPDAFVISTDELETIVRRSPLMIEFRDSRTHEVINADERPMMFDGRGNLASIMFDPKAGTFVTAAKKLGFDEHFYGLGEKAARLDKRRGEFVNWNSDTPGYSEGKDPIYQTIPFYMGLQKGAAYGIFFDNSFRSYFDFGKSSQRYVAFGAEGGEMNYYFFYGPSMKKILARYADLTGHMPLPPMWALGNQQSRWSYYPDSLAEDVVRRYRQDDLPLDVLHLDIDYMQAYRVFTWDTTRFPDPKAFTERLKAQGVKVVTIVDPGVKYQPAERNLPAAGTPPKAPELVSQDANYYVFNKGIEGNYFQKRKSGQLFIPKVWPGDSVFVDFTLGAARRWWGDLHRAYLDQGVAGIWNDMNEPSDFVDQTGKNQMDVVSYDEGEYSTHAKNRNVFALLEARATFEGLERLAPDRRPYIITRAAYAGIQRYSTMWTGDTNSAWDSLALNLPMFETLGLSGEPFIGSDVGGFIGRGNGELLTRSYEVSFLVPFCRNHKTIDGYDQEPWRFGTYYENIIRKYLKLRYRLLPFLYTTLEEAHRTGVPLFRPLLLNYQSDSNTENLDDEFMVGEDLLVAPVLKADVTGRTVYLPPGIWYDYWTGNRQRGGNMTQVDAPLEKVPMFVRGGSILPLAPEMNYVGERPADPITLAIYPDDQGHASTALYEDDGVTPAYRNGVFRRTSVEVASAAGGWRIDVNPEGSFKTGSRNFRFELRSRSAPKEVLLDSTPLRRAAKDEAMWQYNADLITVQVKDDGGRHRITIR